MERVKQCFEEENKMTFTDTFQLNALAPFNFDLSAQIFSSDDSQIRFYENGVFHQVLRINGSFVLVKLNSHGTIEKPKLTIDLKSNNPITPLEKLKVEETIRFIFNLDFDLCSFYEEVKDDSTMHQITPNFMG